MKAPNIQTLSLLAFLGLIDASAAAVEPAQLPEEVQSQINFMVESGLITIDPITAKPTIRIDILKQLKEEGRLEFSNSRDSEVCGGTGWF